MFSEQLIITVTAFSIIY